MLKKNYGKKEFLGLEKLREKIIIIIYNHNDWNEILKKSKKTKPPSSTPQKANKPFRYY